MYGKSIGGGKASRVDSGLIDIAGALVRRGIITKSGRWNKDIHPKLAHRFADKKFYIIEIGLIPKGFKGEVKFLGNTSLEGARLALINRDCYKKLYHIKDNMEVLELSLKENFQEVFISQLNF